MPTNASATLLATREAEAGSAMVEKGLGASLEVEEVKLVWEDLGPSASRMLLLLPGSQSVRTTEGKACSGIVNKLFLNCFNPDYLQDLFEVAMLLNGTS